jgi:glucose/arabinose dehydrogenase
MLVSERPGAIKRIGKDKRVYNIAGVEHIGEGWFLGLALHPKFSENNFIYLYLTTKVGGGLKNRVERYRFRDDSLSEKTIIIDNIPGAAYYDGGRIAFGPDNFFILLPETPARKTWRKTLSLLSLFDNR